MAIEVRVYADEIVVALEKLPAKIRTAVRAKMEMVLAEVKAETLATKPGIFVEPSTIETEVGGYGNTIIGSLEATDKSGVYAILPSKARVLRFVAKTGELVHTQLVLHPYPKGTMAVERALEAKRAQIVDEIEDAVIEAL